MTRFERRPGTIRIVRHAVHLTRFYGWAIVAVCTVVTFAVTGTKSSFGAFFKAIQDDLGWDRGTTAGVAAAHTGAWALSQPMIGYLVDRYGPKRTMTACILLLIIGVLPLFWVQSVWSLYLFLGLLPGVASSGASMIPAASLISRWFHTRAGLASGIVSSAIPLGQAVFTPIAALLVSLIGWRLSYITLGAVLLLVLPLILMFLPGGGASEFGESDGPLPSANGVNHSANAGGLTIKPNWSQFTSLEG